jgi:hypothetical protein
METAAKAGLALFWGCLIGVSIIVTVKTRRVSLAAVTATLSASVLVQLASFIQLGFWEPFYELVFFFSIATGLPVAFLVAFVTGRYLRRHHNSGI